VEKAGDGSQLERLKGCKKARVVGKVEGRKS
jgi:hypothetical protein